MYPTPIPCQFGVARFDESKSKGYVDDTMVACTIMRWTLAPAPSNVYTQTQVCVLEAFDAVQKGHSLFAVVVHHAVDLLDQEQKTIVYS